MYGDVSIGLSQHKRWGWKNIAQCWGEHWAMFFGVERSMSETKSPDT